MTKLEFKTSFFTLNALKMNAKEKESINQLIESLDFGDFNNELNIFLENLFFDLVKRYNFINFKEFLECFNENVENLIIEKAKHTKIKNFTHELFLQEQEILQKYYRVKFYKNLPYWVK